MLEVNPLTNVPRGYLRRLVRRRHGARRDPHRRSERAGAPGRPSPRQGNPSRTDTRYGGGMTRALDQLARVVPTLGLSGTSFSILIIVGSLLRGAALVPRSRRGASTQDSVPPPPAAPRADPARHADILGPALPHQGPISPVHRPGAGTSRRRSEPAPLRPRFRRAGLGNYLARPSCVATRVAFTEG